MSKQFIYKALTDINKQFINNAINAFFSIMRLKIVFSYIVNDQLIISK